MSIIRHGRSLAGRAREAADVLRRSSAIAEGLLADDPGRAAYRRTLGTALLNLASLEYTLGRTAPAATRLRGRTRPPCARDPRAVRR